MSRISVVPKSRAGAVAARVSVVLIAAAIASAGEKQPLSGGVSGGLAPGEYVVKSTITVPEGESLSLRGGTTLYFEQLTGVDVRGELSVDGAPGAPVILTSVNDSAGSAEPAQAFDWNGIKAEGPAASVSLRHARVSHSVYGLNLRDPAAKAELEGVVFQNNGYASVVVGQEIVPVAAGEPFSERWNAGGPPPGQAAPAGKPAGNGRVRLIFNAGALGVTAAGVTIYAVNLAQTSTYFKHYSRDENSARLSSYYEEKIRGNITMGTVGAVITGIGLGCVGVALFF
jgi:hypothetical protein